MVQAHEYHINNNTESDEELCEGVKHNDREHLSKGVLNCKYDIVKYFLWFWENIWGDLYLRSSDPEPAAVPDAHHVRGPLDTVKHDVLHLGSLVIIILKTHIVTMEACDTI